mmetsp:Transcript_148140/g.258478  ORF Transcript_148140/g.258478 Transcript_148140/m.258478 type:complete len:551 (-) Transcript_148140:117-1769(-)
MATRKALASSSSAPEIGSAATRGNQRQLKENDRARFQRMLTRATSGQGASGETKRPPPGGAPRARLAPSQGATAQGDASPGAGARRSTGHVGAATRSFSAGGQHVESIPRGCSLAHPGALGTVVQTRGYAAVAEKLAVERSAPSPTAGNRRQPPGAHDDGHTPRTDKAQQFVRKLLGQDGAKQGSLDWRLVQEMDAVDYLVQEDKTRKQAQAQKQNLRANLHNLQHEKKLAALRDREENRQWGTKMHREADRFWEEEQMRRQEKMEAQHRFNQEQAAHIHEMGLRRQEEKQREMDLEREMHERAVLAKQIEVARQEESVRKRQAAAAQVMEDARQAQARKREKRRDEAERDMAMLRIQQEVLNKQEQDRLDYFDNIKKRQDVFKAHQQVNVREELHKKNQEADERTKRQMTERLSKDRNADEEKQRRLKQLAMDGHAEVERQLEEKSQKRAREREESLRLAEEFQREAKLAKEEEARKVQDRREKEKENQRYLLAQMEQRSSTAVPGKFGHEQMNEVEKALNRERLDRAKGNDTLQMLFRSKQLQYSLVK